MVQAMAKQKHGKGTESRDKKGDVPAPKIDEKLLDKTLRGGAIDPVEIPDDPILDRAKAALSEKVQKTGPRLTLMDTYRAMGRGPVKRRKPEPKKTEMNFENEEDFIEFMQEIAANVGGSPLYNDALVEELGTFLRSHFNRVRAAQTPPVPRRKYTPRKDEIIPFLREVWGEWLADDKLTKQVLKDHDTPAYNALSNWQRNNDLPDDMTIKTLADLNNEFLEWGYYRRDEVHRVASALARRGLDA